MALSQRQKEMIDALMAADTKTSAIAMAGVNKVTLWRWFQKEEFQQAYDERLREARREAVILAQKRYLHIIRTWLTILDDDSAPPASRTRAGELIINFGQKGGELDELAKRLDHLEGYNTNDDHSEP
jgi:hypothetical protein